MFWNIMIMTSNVINYDNDCRSHSAGATTASTMYTFHDAPFLKLSLWYPTDAVRCKICISCLYTTQAAKIFITNLFPLCNEVFVSNVFI